MKNGALSMLPETSTPSSIGRDHFAWMDNRLEERLQRVRTAHVLLVNVDLLIDLAGKILEISQPPMEGKLGLRWWAKHEGRRTPTLVRWEKGKSKRFKPIAIPVAGCERRVKTREAFEPGAPLTLATMGILAKLLKMHESLQKSQLNVERSMIPQIEEFGPLLADQLSTLEGLERDAHARLAMYAKIPPMTMDTADDFE